MGGNGAGIYNGGTLKIYNSTFTGNNAYPGLLGSRGGAIYNAGTAWITNSTFTGNYANWGGAIGNEFSLIVSNSTFSGNDAEKGGAIWSFTSPNNLLHLRNNILANTISTLDCFSDMQPATDVNNLIEFHSNCGEPVYSGDPKLGPLADNGGPTQTFALLLGSLAIDAGNQFICDADPVLNVDQRGVVRPYGASCDMGSYELKKGSLMTQSVAANDGWILEITETSAAGGTINATAVTFNLGDEAGDRQYRGILSFDTTDLPDSAVITKITLKIRKQGLIGTDPFTILNGLRVDVRKPYFGTGLGLVASDFQADAGQMAVGTFRTTPVNNWYFAVIGSAGYPHINRTGTTQFRLRFHKDDNDDNAADYMKFFSGNYTNAAARPMLIIQYYVP